MLTSPPEIPDRPDRQLRQLLDVYRRAQNKLSTQLTDAALTSFQEFRIREQLRQVDAIVTALAIEARKFAKTIPAYYRAGADWATEALKSQGVKVDKLNMGNIIHTAAVQAVSQQMLLDLVTAGQGMKRVASDILRHTQQKLITEKQINRIIAEGLVTGDTRRDVSARLTEALRAKLKNKHFVQAGAANFTPEYYAELVVRTRTREAVTAGTVNRSSQYGITLFQVSVHSTECAICGPKQGKIYSTDPGSKFPRLVERPPFHPNCKHVLVPYVAVPGDDKEQAALLKFSNSKKGVQTFDEYVSAVGDTQPVRGPAETP